MKMTCDKTNKITDKYIEVHITGWDGEEGETKQ